MNKMIDRSVSISLLGKDYHMLLTIDALCEIYKTYEDLDALDAKLDMTANKLSDVLDVMAQIIVILGDAYTKMQDFTGVPVKDQQQALPAGAMREIIGCLMPFDTIRIRTALLAAVTSGMVQTVETDEDNNKTTADGSKN